METPHFKHPAPTRRLLLFDASSPIARDMLHVLVRILSPSWRTICAASRATGNQGWTMGIFNQSSLLVDFLGWWKKKDSQIIINIDMFNYFLRSMCFSHKTMRIGHPSKMSLRPNPLNRPQKRQWLNMVGSTQLNSVMDKNLSSWFQHGLLSVLHLQQKRFVQFCQK